MNKSKDKTMKETVGQFFTKVIDFLQFLLDGSFITPYKAPTMEQLRVDNKY
jgi:hypothetical protein